MCNIAGYVGNRPAAPILIDMMRREEGFWGGYYVGISTIDDGKIYTAKVMGDLDELLRTTDALRLPGTIGIMHTRTPSGGDWKWSYPFVSCDGKLSFVENGSQARFLGKTDFVGAAAMLTRHGHHFSSQTPGQVARYPLLPDGTCVHYSELQCHLMEENMRSGMSPEAALKKTLLDYPCEDVALAIHSEYPNRIFAARFNQPMFVHCTGEEAFLASTQTAFPDPARAGGAVLLTANSSATVTPSGYTIAPFIAAPLPVAPISTELFSQIRMELLDALRHDSMSFPEIADFCQKRMGDCSQALSQNAALGYMIQENLLRSGEAKIIVVHTKGMAENLTAPQYRLCAVQP